MEQKKQASPKTPEKKLSRTTLTFYIIGLFSVAIALILISYVAQARADRQLDSLNDKLTEQRTVAQGATQKMEDLQRKNNLLGQELFYARAALGLDDGEPVTEDTVAAAQAKADIASLLLSAEHAARLDDRAQLAAALDALDALLEAVPADADSPLTDEQAAIHQQLIALLQEAPDEPEPTERQE